MEQNVLSKMPFINLGGLTVNLQRADGQNWMALKGSKVDGMKEATQQAVLSKQNHCSAEFRCVK